MFVLLHVHNLPFALIIGSVAALEAALGGMAIFQLVLLRHCLGFRLKKSRAGRNPHNS